MIFREVLRPPIWVLAFIYFILLSLVIAIWAAFDERITLVAFVIATIAVGYLGLTWRSTILITDGELQIERAHIERNFIGHISVLDADQMRLLRTRDANPSAFLALKFWTSRGIKIEITDPRDPTPYWLVTSKRGDEIAALLN